MPDPDVSDTLDALERKLRDLERELHGVAAPPEVAPVAPTRGEGLTELAGQIDELGGYRERLARTQRGLEDEYGRMLGRLEGLVGRPAAPAAAMEAERHEPEPEAPAAAPEHEPVQTWVVDAGPFADLAALSTYERELAVLGAVEVTGFEGRRALLELRGAREADLRAAGLMIVEPGRARADL